MTFINRSSAEFTAFKYIPTPLGPVITAAIDEGVCLIEFYDQKTSQNSISKLQQEFGGRLLPASNDILESLSLEIKDYFDGRLRRFNTSLALQGTSFQLRVWDELCRIPYGETASYQEIARRIGNPRAVRPVARAVSMNRINIIIPCHRVIGKGGELRGYGGGLWRKRLLLELERTGRLHGQG